MCMYNVTCTCMHVTIYGQYFACTIYTHTHTHTACTYLLQTCHGWLPGAPCLKDGAGGASGKTLFQERAKEEREEITVKLCIQYMLVASMLIAVVCLEYFFHYYFCNFFLPSVL